MKFVIRIGALIGVVVAPGGTTAGASPSAPATYGPLRAWGGTEIQSLDPARLSSSASVRTTRHRDQLLSNENTFTRWAYVNRIAWIHQAPSGSSRRVERLTWYTADGFSAIYLLLRAHWDAHGREWVKLRIPGRPNGRTGWVQRSALGSFHLTHLLVVVDREQRQMSFYSRGRRIWTAPVGVGKPATPTPTGHFWIDERFEITNPGSGYYPYAFGTTDYSTLSEWPGGGVVGIHGPYYDPQGIPGYISHGCIRLRVSDDFWLAGHLQLGTPLRVV
ncbi:MAG TPA: L,D-transpeptidase [Solirubrobacteraceae bacterium]|nr:L,D-transpeptidase [Solirubrobacteraceae bacterium]